MKPVNNFTEFYKLYISFHENHTSRRLHFIGTSLFLLSVIVVHAMGWDPEWKYILPFAGIGYLLAWIGHYKYEGNKPATFNNPIWSARAGARMYLELLTGRMKM